MLYQCSFLDVRVCMSRCGTGAVVLLWEVTLEVVSVNGEATSYYLDSSSHLAQEADGVRVVGSTGHDLLQKVMSALCVVVSLFSALTPSVLGSIFTMSFG